MNSRVSRKKRKRKNWAALVLLPIMLLIVGLIFIPPLLNDEPEIERPVAEEVTLPVDEEEDVEEPVAVEEPEEQESPTVEYTPPKSTEPTSTTEVTVVIGQKPVEAEPEKDKNLLVADATGTVFTIYSDSAQGSGFLYNEKGDIVTNAHVVRGSYKVNVKNNTGATFTGYVIGVSDTTDVALIRVPDLKGKAPMKFSGSLAGVDTAVTAIGSPGDQANTSTTGVIQNTNVSVQGDYTYTNLYEITAKIAQGSSGGPLLRNDTGEIIGINTLVSVTNPQVGYAIPIHLVGGILSQFVTQADKSSEAELEEPSRKDQAYFSEELVTNFIVDFNEIVFMYLENENAPYFQHYFLDAEVGKAQLATYRAEVLTAQPTPVFQPVEILDMTITDDLVTMNVAFNVAGPTAEEGEEPVVHQRVFAVEIIIDDYGDYKIQSFN
ncbi:S1C family serine protease [Chryseomicrobium palamuruense]